MQTAVPTELCYSMTDPRMPMFAKPLGVAGDEMVADKVQVIDPARGPRKRPKMVGMGKVGLIAHHMQNFLRNMISILFLMCGSLMMSKLRVLDGPQSWDFNLEGIPGWREIQMTNMTSQKFQKHHYSTCTR